MNIKELIGERILMHVKEGYGKTIDEFRVIEMSPSGNWIKLRNVNGKKFWKPTVECSVLEVLKPIEFCPSPQEKPNA